VGPPCSENAAYTTGPRFTVISERAAEHDLDGQLQSVATAKCSPAKNGCRRLAVRHVPPVQIIRELETICRRDAQLLELLPDRAARAIGEDAEPFLPPNWTR
jgi:hypothetical protein